MAFRSFRNVLAVSSLLATVGLIQACTPPPPPQSGYGPPSSVCQTPTMPAPLPTPSGYVPQNPPLPAPAGSSVLSIVGGKLQLQTADGSRSICERLTIVVSGADPVEVTVVGKQIQIAGGKDVKGGTFLQGAADRLTRSGFEGGLVTLEGNAKLIYARAGHKAEISANRISVHLVPGQIEVELDVPKPVTPTLPPGGVTQVTPTYSSVPSLGDRYRP